MIRLGEMEFEAANDRVRIRTPKGTSEAPRHWFLRGIHRLLMFELRLNDIRLYGGVHFIMPDDGETVTVGLRRSADHPEPYYETFGHAEVMDWLKRAHDHLAPDGFTHYI